MVVSAPYFRITGGAVWIGPGALSDVPLVRFTRGRWQYASNEWAGLRFDGKCRLILGPAREPSAVSDVLQGLSISGVVLSGNGIPFAAYDEEREMWKGATNSWWHAFRIESAELRASSATSEKPSIRSPQSPEVSGLSETPNLHLPRDRAAHETSLHSVRGEAPVESGTPRQIKPRLEL